MDQKRKANSTKGTGKKKKKKDQSKSGNNSTDKDVKNIGRIFKLVTETHGNKALKEIEKNELCTYVYSSDYTNPAYLQSVNLANILDATKPINDEILHLVTSIHFSRYVQKGTKIHVMSPFFSHQLLNIKQHPGTESFDFISENNDYQVFSQHVAKSMGLPRKAYKSKTFKLDNMLQQKGITEILIPVCIPYRKWFLVSIRFDIEEIMCYCSNVESILFGNDGIPDVYKDDKTITVGYCPKRISQLRTGDVDDLNSQCDSSKFVSKHITKSDAFTTLFFHICLVEVANFIFDQLNLSKKQRKEWDLGIEMDCPQESSKNSKNGALYVLNVIESKLRDYNANAQYMRLIASSGRKIILSTCTNPNVVKKCRVVDYDSESDSDDEMEIFDNLEVVENSQQHSVRNSPKRKAKKLSQIDESQSLQLPQTSRLSSLAATLLNKHIHRDYSSSEPKLLRNTLKEFGAYILTDSPLDSSLKKEVKIIAYIVCEKNHSREFFKGNDGNTLDRDLSHSCGIIHLHSCSTNDDRSDDYFEPSVDNNIVQERRKHFFADNIAFRYLMANVVRMMTKESESVDEAMTALYFPVYRLSPPKHVRPETRNSNCTDANPTIEYPDKYTINGDQKSIVDQNASFRKLFGFVNDKVNPKGKIAVNSYPTTSDYEWVHKPNVPNAGNILLIGQTFSFISKHVCKEYFNMEHQIRYLFQIPQTTDMKSCVTYLDPHAVSEIQCYPSPNGSDNPILYARNKWFGFKKIVEGGENELRLSKNLSTAIDTLKAKTKKRNARQTRKTDFAGAISFLSTDRSCAWKSLKSMFNRHYCYLFQRCERVENSYPASTFEDLRFFSPKNTGQDITLSILLSKMSLNVKKVIIPKNEDTFQYLMDKLEKDKLYMCILTNLHEESIHAIGIETFGNQVLLNDSGIIHLYNGRESLSKCLGNVPCVGIQYLCKIVIN